MVGYPSEFRYKRKGTTNYGISHGVVYNVTSDAETKTNGVDLYRQNISYDMVTGSSNQVPRDGQQYQQLPSTGTTSCVNSYIPRGSAPITKDQYDQILKLLSQINLGSIEASTNTTGMPEYVALMTSKYPEWIVDTGATNHMALSLNLIDQTSITKAPSLKRVHLSNGDVTLVTHTGSSAISNKGTVSNVFHVLEFKFNLLSVSKLTKELQCYASFYLDFCLFGDLFNRRVKEIGKQVDDLYILLNHHSNNDQSVTISAHNSEFTTTDNSDINLWHMSLGHTSILVLKRFYHLVYMI